MRRGTSVLLLVLLFSLPVASLADELSQSRLALLKIQQRLDDAAATLAEKEAARKSLESELGKVESQMQALQQQLAKEQAGVRSLERQIKEHEGEHQLLEGELQKLQKTVFHRLRALYKGEDLAMVKILLEPASPGRLMKDYLFMGRIVRRDRELLAMYRQQQQSVLEQKTRLERLRQQRQEGVARQLKQKETLAEAGKLKEGLLAAVRSDQQTLQQQQKRLEAKAAELSSLIDRLVQRQRAASTAQKGGFAQQKGKLDWPYPDEVLIPFGRGRHPELGTTYDSRGIEVACRSSQPLKSVWSGEVVFAERFPGYGNLMIIDHGDDYFTILAHLSRMLKEGGEAVKQGEIVAYGGETGENRYYFEVRQKGEPLDPLHWLTSRP